MPLELPEPIDTPRLRLRRLAPEDLEALFEVYADDETTRFLPSPAWRTLDDGRAWFERMTALQAGGGTLQLVMVDRRGRGEAGGDGGAWSVAHAGGPPGDPSLDPPGDPSGDPSGDPPDGADPPRASEREGRAIGTLLLFRHDVRSARAELGYVLGRAHHGRGLMHEALSALITTAFGALGLRRLEAEVDPDNGASERVLRRLGFTCEGRLHQRWVDHGRAHDTQMFGLLRDEWVTLVDASGQERTVHATPGVSPGPGFAVLYRWRLHPGAEDAFVRAWTRVSEGLRRQRGGLGSRLHRMADGTWVSYAQWPSAQARQEAFAAGPVDAAAAEQMAASIAESFPEQVLEPVADLLLPVPPEPLPPEPLFPNRGD